ncbi:GMC oxidoreductase [Polyporus arcularius HHB13444]|uniref:GMC oxidoreductase n=1 Tax=Polyporus arcularius HHB13444 TaxID=1314778 RepID=A0A5C3PG39_9APHY|nr:GMC oxidoreductase [Polyporus arcularius HHB13444]
MGLSQSRAVVNDPSKFATKVTTAVDNSGPWKGYDYVIVGGGTAGCVLAARLSENRDSTVLLVEAGRSHVGDLQTSNPLGFSNIFKTARDWNLHTSKKKHLNERETYWPRGKILGGTSATNALIYHRCPPEDFNEWVTLGAKGWSYSDSKPYFVKSEAYCSNPKWHPEINAVEHGSDGPWKIRHPSETAPSIEAIIQPCQNLGMRHIHDMNAGSGSLGVSRFMGSMDTRSWTDSTSTAYLTDDVLARPNLTIAVDTTGEKVLFSTSSGGRPRAIGIEVATGPDSPRFLVSAAREVILCGGAVGTPQVWLLSGVGPANELIKLDIPVVKELPAVGRNPSDHVSSGPLAFRAKPGSTYDYITNPISGLFAMFKWLIFGRGPLSSMGWSSAAFVRSMDHTVPHYVQGECRVVPVNDRTSGPDVPDLELICFPLTVFDDAFPKPPPGTSGITLAAVALRTESRGRITLRSASAWDKSVIDPNYLSTESDMNILVCGVRLLMRIARTEPLASKLTLKPHATDPTSPWWPGDADPDWVSDDEICDLLRRSALPAWHPVSSARMGVNPEDSVVDPELHVHGISGLRVVEASDFPAQLSGHPCAVVVAIAEKAADMIKQDSIM